MNPPAPLGELHNRLLAGDPAAPAEIADRLFPSLGDDLHRKYPGDRYRDLVTQAVADALLNYFKRPEQYDPAKGKLRSYLRMSALGDLKNALRSERNLQEKFPTGVELSQFPGKGETEGDDSIVTLQAEELREEIRTSFPEERDWRMAELIIDQERRTEAFAEILGITHLPWEKQQSEVKRHKDRIKQKLRRFGDSIRESDEPE